MSSDTAEPCLQLQLHAEGAIRALSHRLKTEEFSCRLVVPVPQQRRLIRASTTTCMAKAKETTEVNFVPFQEVRRSSRKARHRGLKLQALHLRPSEVLTTPAWPKEHHSLTCIYSRGGLCLHDLV